MFMLTPPGCVCGLTRGMCSSGLFTRATRLHHSLRSLRASLVMHGEETRVGRPVVQVQLGTAASSLGVCSHHMRDSVGSLAACLLQFPRSAVRSAQPDKAALFPRGLLLQQALLRRTLLHAQAADASRRDLEASVEPLSSVQEFTPTGVISPGIQISAVLFGSHPTWML